MSDRSIEFDVSLNLEDLRQKLKEVEKQIEQAKKRIEKNNKTYEWADIKRAEANAIGDEKGAEAYAKMMAQAQDATEKEMYNIGVLGEEQFKLEQEIEATATATTQWSKAAQNVSAVMETMKRRVKQLLKNALIFTVIAKLFYKIRDAFANTLKDNEQITKSVSQLKQAFEGLIAPLANALAPVLAGILNWLTRIIQALTIIITKLFPRLGRTAKSASRGKGGGGSQLAGFDTIMKLGSGGGSEEEQAYQLAQLTADEYAGILATVGLIGAALLAWKIPSAIAGFFGNFVLWAGVIASVVLALHNFADMLENGIDWSNLLGLLAGVLLAAKLLGVMFGFVAQNVVYLVGGVLSMIAAFKDASENGVNLYNTLAMVAGLILTGLGIAELTGNIKFLIAAGILALMYALAALGGEGDRVIQGIKTAFEGLTTFIKNMLNGDWKAAFQGLWQFLLGLKEAIVGLFSGMWNAIKALGKEIANGFIGLVNQLISRVNNLIEKFNSGTLGTFLQRMTGFGGIPTLNSIPYLAQGAVIPPNREFMAVLGDQKSGVNIETPLETMIEAFRQAQSEQSINITFNGDLAALAAILRPQITQQSKRRGI